jgi:hypothetical protein
VTLVVLCLGVELDGRWAAWCSALQGGAALRRPGTALALDLLGGGVAERARGALARRPEAPLRGSGILRAGPDPHGGQSALALTDAALAALAGHVPLLGRPWLRVVAPRRDPEDDVTAAVEPLVRAGARLLAGGTWADGAVGSRLVACLTGPSSVGVDAAHAAASLLGLPLLVLDVAVAAGASDRADPASAGPASLADAVREATLQARIAPALLLVILPDPSPARGEAPERLRADVDALVGEVVDVIDRTGWLTLVATGQSLGGRRKPSGVPWITVALPERRTGDLARRWLTELSAAGVPASEAEASSLASRFRAETTGIPAVVSAAVASARLRGSPVTVTDVESAAREGGAPALGAGALRVRSRLAWTDLVLPRAQQQQLAELTAAVGARRRVLSDWGFGEGRPRGRGIAALFSGAPGTGKTLAAEIVAAQLGLDLFAVDLASAISKYIGETEKNLSRIFAAAADTDGLLFFDEADALFGKRSEVKDAHDRYANIEISYLLQRIEAHDGLVVLATNLERHLDDAFLRRLAFVVKFPFPSFAERRLIWQVQLPAAAPVEDDVDWDLLASFPLAGGSIHSAVLHAAYQAAAAGRPIGTVRLLVGLRRELEKHGRVPAEADFGPYWREVTTGMSPP